MNPDELQRKLSNYDSDEFYISDHVFDKIDRYMDFNMQELLTLLKTHRYRKIAVNDSKKEDLQQYESYKVYINKSRAYVYCIVLYLMDKPLIKTVYKLDRKKQEEIGL